MSTAFTPKIPMSTLSRDFHSDSQTNALKKYISLCHHLIWKHCQPTYHQTKNRRLMTPLSNTFSPCTVMTARNNRFWTFSRGSDTGRMRLTSRWCKRRKSLTCLVRISTHRTPTRCIRISMRLTAPTHRACKTTTMTGEMNISCV